MGRPKEHGEETKTALLDAAEWLVEHEGLDALSVRRVADEIGTTTRAVYSVFGSKAGLVVALGSRAFDWLASELDALPLSSDPIADLVEAGAVVFRRLVVEHTSLFRVGVQQTGVGRDVASEMLQAAENAMKRLESRLERLQRAGRLRDRTIREAAFEFHALCEGLAALELRCTFTPGDEERMWRNALSTLINGLKLPTSQPASRRSSPRSTTV